MNKNLNLWRPVLRLVRDPLRTEASDEAIDRQQFARQMLPHLDDAYRYARYLARDQSMAEDVVQEAFLRALKGYASCRSNEKAWLFAIVRNCFIDLGKSNRAVPEDFAEVLAEAQLNNETPETLLLRRREAMSVRDAIAGMPEPFRETIVLRELDALSYREIAAITDVPIGTVMSRLARARSLLATLFLSHDKKGMSA